MIDQLMVQDYILFDHAQIDFKRNMAVITGETGAGKSLLIDAIHVISGGRVSKDVVRKGKKRAVLQMVLSDPSDDVKAMLAEAGFDEEDQIILTRIIQAEGKSKMLVNDRQTTNAFVAKLVSKMIDIHSQMDTIRLMDPALQLDLLDRYAKNESLRKELEVAYRNLHAKIVEIHKLKQETFSNAHLENITKQINEIEQAKVQPQELEQLQEKIEQAEKSQSTLENLSQALYLWKKEQGINDQFAQAIKRMESAFTSEDYAGKMQDLYYQVQDLFEQIEQAKEDVTEGSMQLDAMQEREFFIQSLYKKYGGNYAAMMETLASLNEQVDCILNRQDVLDRLEKEKRELTKAYTQLASAIHRSRKQAVETLCTQIEAHAKDLMLEHCRFDIRFTQKKPSKDGMDEIEFIASMNPGQPLTPIKLSASGGELSRLMLALKVVFQAEDGIGTLIFDEIDTGVSGKVALAMGSKMHALAKYYQVLCITHLSSVAVWADDHFSVVKRTDGMTTTTSVNPLDEQSRLEELAIMTSGNADAKAIESMKELLERVRHG